LKNYELIECCVEETELSWTYYVLYWWLGIVKIMTRTRIKWRQLRICWVFDAKLVGLCIEAIHCCLLCYHALHFQQ